MSFNVPQTKKKKNVVRVPHKDLKRPVLGNNRIVIRREISGFKWLWGFGPDPANPVFFRIREIWVPSGDGLVRCGRAGLWVSMVFKQPPRFSVAAKPKYEAAVKL